MALLDSMVTAEAEKEHYDTPWEFKNRALTAVLRQQEQRQQQHGNGNGEVGNGMASGRTAKAAGKAMAGGNRPAAIARNRLSLPPDGQTQQQQKKKGGNEEQQQQKMSNSMSAQSAAEGNGGRGTKQQKEQQKKQPIKLAPVARPPPSVPLHGRQRSCPVTSMPPPLPAHHQRAQSMSQGNGRMAAGSQSASSSSSAHSPGNSLGNSSGGASPCPSQQSPLPSPQHKKFSLPLFGQNKHQKQSRQRQPMAQGSSRAAGNWAHSAHGEGPSVKEVMAFCQRHHHRGQRWPAASDRPAAGDKGSPPLPLDELEEEGEGEEDESQGDQQDLGLVHDQLERAAAELLLGGMRAGTHLLRRRPDGSLALSLRATGAVLHIKLDWRGGHWVLGEGPRFGTVRAMLAAYRRVELPVRGAEQIRLGALIRPGGDVHGGLLLL